MSSHPHRSSSTSAPAPYTQDVASKPPPLSDFGGLEGIRAVLTDFYERVFRDPMIGYLFAGQARERLIARETEWTARALGASVSYQGRSLARAHQAHPIRRGHFYRRNQLLFQSIEEAQITPEAAAWWREHSQALEGVILGRARADKRCEQTSDGSHIDPKSSQEPLWTPLSQRPWRAVEVTSREEET